ncbi:hypothetical [Yersinia pestis KIM10+]|uniref:Uncharacterized protein n=1 Tax=Yersinia pestis TaxID=632 RepID=Q8CL99_YERPE|nr:hypothetical [Yersinia pestis KIM10+]
MPWKMLARGFHPCTVHPTDETLRHYPRLLWITVE